MPTQRKPTPRKAAYKQVETPLSSLESDRRIPLIVLAVIAALMLLVLIFTQCSTTSDNQSLASSSEDVVSATSEAGVIAGDVEPPSNPSARASLAEYSWEELSQISKKIAAATTNDDAIYVARQYNLVDAAGMLDGSATKTVSFADGSTGQVRIIGFNHDSASDGSGIAGITFMFADGVASMAFNEDGSSAGGWPVSSASYYLGVELWNLLPEDLAENIVEVSKNSNTGEENSVVESGDVMWLPSYVEVVGTPDPELQNVVSTLQQEGSQYQLFSDVGVSASGNNSLLVMHDGAQASAWWLRTADVRNEGSVCYVNAAGNPTNSGASDQAYLLVPCFCI